MGRAKPLRSSAWRHGSRAAARSPCCCASPAAPQPATASARSCSPPAPSAVAPMAEMALMFADRAQAIAEVIQPALDAGRIVVCDRFTDSTEAYQGGGRELGSQVVLDMHRLICGGLQPDLTLLLLPGFAASLNRARRRNDRVEAETGSSENRFESEKDAFFRRVWEKYREIAAREPDRVVLIEGDLSIDEVHEQILEAVAERIVTHTQKV